jgi:hypothetical protein
MKLAVTLLWALGALHAVAPLHADVDSVSPSAAVVVSPVAATSSGVGQSVEEHFQSARRLYLSGDRDAALSELNQALRLDPYHPGSAGLYKTIHEEELSLRQVRLQVQAAAAAPTPIAVATEAPAASSAPASQASRNFWRGMLNFEDRTVKRLDGLERNSLQVSGDLGILKSQVEGQKDLLGAVNQDVKRVSVRQDNLMLGLLALLLALIVLLIMTLRMLMNMRGELSTVESRLHEHPGAKRRP